MNASIVHRFPSRLPADDDHPYRTGAWRPNVDEWDADDLDVIQGAIPAALDGVYLRNTENPLLPSIGRYHPFDGDGWLHAIRFEGGRASYRSRAVRTRGLTAELEAGAPLWAGIFESPRLSLRDGWGARTRLKDASSTDVVVHAGKALSTFYQCGEVYQLDPVSLAQLGPADWGGRFGAWGVSAHPKVDPHTGELLYFAYSTEAPYLVTGALDRRGRLVRETEVALPGPRLPHDMAFTERFVIVNDLPLFWDPERIAEGVYRPRFHPELPSRFALVPRAGGQTRWFEASPTFVLHWINAFEDGDEVVLDGYHQADPTPRASPADGPWGPLMKMHDLLALGARPHRWRFDLRTGRTREERLWDDVSEFPSIDQRVAGRRHRYAWSMTNRPGWFIFEGLVRLDLETGATQRWAFPEGVIASESPFAPRPGGTAEDDGWIVTFVSDVPRDISECHIFDARHIDAGPVARVRLPERIASGTHACWANASELGPA
ncbi:MAG: carotenoid oxygenase family protein [Deltaproteobacteria bacterium]|nr:carotenoid oxygenase family protein [Deltaproteobacteria bacterium]